LQDQNNACRNFCKHYSASMVTNTQKLIRPTGLSAGGAFLCAARRYSPAEVVAVSREIESGTPSYISTSYVERQNLTLRMTQKRFARLTNGFSKKLTHHAAAVSLYVTHYNLCRVHEVLRTTPGVALGVADRVWTIGDLLDATLAIEPNRPVRTRRNFTVIEGGKG
jgi:hypothetical protein